MRPKLMFNTLKYAKLLDKGGVDKSEIYTQALEAALSENLYMASEVDEMYNNLVTAIEKLKGDMNHRFEAAESKMKLEIVETGNRVTIRLGALIALMTGILAILHFVH